MQPEELTRRLRHIAYIKRTADSTVYENSYCRYATAYDVMSDRRIASQLGEYDWLRLAPSKEARIDFTSN